MPALAGCILQTESMGAISTLAAYPAEVGNTMYAPVSILSQQLVFQCVYGCSPYSYRKNS